MLNSPSGSVTAEPFHTPFRDAAEMRAPWIGARDESRMRPRSTAAGFGESADWAYDDDGMRARVPRQRPGMNGTARRNSDIRASGAIAPAPEDGVHCTPSDGFRRAIRLNRS